MQIGNGHKFFLKDLEFLLGDKFEHPLILGIIEKLKSVISFQGHYIKKNSYAFLIV